MKVTCIYHGNCFDGICAAWVVSKVYPNAEFIPANYGQPFPTLDFDKVIIVDFSYPRYEMLSVKHDEGKEILVLDHHKTAQANCEGLDFCRFDMNESGASLAWKYFFPDKGVPLLVRYIKDRDLWLFKEEHSEEVNACIQSFPMEIDAYDELDAIFTREGWQFFYNGGQHINRYKNQMVENICKTAYFSDDNIFNIHVPIVNTSSLFSEVGNRLCKLYPDAPFGAYYYDRLKDNVRQWGLRSIGDFDVSMVAKEFGGGGHKNAAGFEISLGDRI